MEHGTLRSIRVRTQYLALLIACTRLVFTRGVGTLAAPSAGQHACTLATVVTAASTAYFDELLNLVGSLHTYAPGKRILIYDLGLSPQNAAAAGLLESVEVVQFAFDRFPPHVRDLKTYAWKACVVQDAVERAGCVLFLDAGMELRNELADIEQKLASHGHWFVCTQENLKKLVHPGTRRALGLDESAFADQRSLAVGMMGWCRHSTVWEELFVPWLDCSLQLECIFPHGANAANHRPEQSALSLLFWKINVGRRAGPTATEKLVLFSKMDKDRSGGLNAEELQINSRLDGKHLNETELNNLFHAFDSNQDGFLDFQELDRNGNGMQGALSERGLDRHMFYETSRIYWVSNSVVDVQNAEKFEVPETQLACRSIATSELVLERRRREAGHTVTPNEIKLWKQQLQHVLAIISDIERGSSGSGAGDSMGDAKGGYHLYLAAAVYRQLLSLKQAFATEGGAQIADPNASPDCQEFVEVLESIPATGAHTLSYYEAVMHTCACFFLHNKYSRSTALYWQHFYRLPSLLEPLERIRQVPVVEDFQNESILEESLRGFMVVLTSNSSRDLKDLHHAISLLDANCASMSSYTLLVFHDGLSELQAAEVQGLRRKGRVVVEFLQLRDLAYETIFEARGGTYFKNPDKAHKDGQGAGRGYMHMIRLYSGMLFQHPIFHAFDNYIRLDTDSFFVGETEDLMQQVTNASSKLRKTSGHAEAHVSYGYWMITSDSPAVTRGVWNMTKTFMSTLELTAASMNAHLVGDVAHITGEPAWNLDVFYNNLELVRMQWIRGRLCSDYFRYVDWNVEWFRQRWSDAVVRSMQVFMSLQSAESMQLRVSYKHQAPTICKEYGSHIYLIRDMPHPEPSLCQNHGKRIHQMNKRLLEDRRFTGSELFALQRSGSGHGVH